MQQLEGELQDESNKGSESSDRRPQDGHHGQAAHSQLKAAIRMAAALGPHETAFGVHLKGPCSKGADRPWSRLQLLPAILPLAVI